MTLTKEQQAKLEEYRDVWLAKGLSTEPSDRPKSEEAISLLMKEAGYHQNFTFQWVSGPTEALKLCKKIGKEDKESAMQRCLWGQFEAFWVCFYVYAENVMDYEYTTEERRELHLWADIATSCGFWWPYPDQNTIIASERPSSLSIVEGRMHREDGPAVEFRDGTVLYVLNGVKVDDWIVTTPPEEMDAAKVLKITNAEVRAQAVRKMGVERIYEHLGGKVLDEYWHTTPDGKEHPYELVELKIPGLREPARFLKMLNPSTEEIHMEGVPPEIETCKDALKWRNPWGDVFDPVQLN